MGRMLEGQMKHGEHEVTLAENPSQGTKHGRIHNVGGGLSAGQHPYQSPLACTTFVALGARCIEMQVQCSLFRAQLRPPAARSSTQQEVTVTDHAPRRIGQQSEACERRWSRQPAMQMATEALRRLLAFRHLYRVVHAGSHGTLIGA